MLSVTLDSNIYISALNYAGPPLRIVNMARDGLIRLDLSNAILEEVGGVLRDKFHWREEDVELAIITAQLFAAKCTDSGARGRGI